MQGPLFGLDGEIRPGAFDVDEGDEDVRDGGFSSLDDVRDELTELGVFVGAGGGSSARRGRGDIKGVGDDIDGRLHELFYKVQVGNGRVDLVWGVHTD